MPEISGFSCSALNRQAGATATGVSLTSLIPSLTAASTNLTAVSLYLTGIR